MPNYCDNRITVTGEEEDMAEFYELVQSDASMFTFEKVVPEPAFFDLMQSGKMDFVVDGEVQTHGHWIEGEGLDGEKVARPLSEAELAQFKGLARPDPDCWRDAHWGTKWGAIDVFEDTDEETATYSFTTAWSPPHGIIEALREKFPDLDIVAFFDCEEDQEAGYY